MKTESKATKKNLALQVAGKIVKLEANASKHEFWPPCSSLLHQPKRPQAK